MAKTVKQLTEQTTCKTYDLVHVVDIDNDQDKKMKMANIWSAKPYGEFYLNANATVTTHAVANTYYNITTGGVTTTAGDSNLVTVANGKLTYTGTEDVKVLITVSGSYRLNSAGGVTRQAGFSIYISNVALTKSQVFPVALGNATAEYTPLSMSCITTLSLNDYVELFSKQTVGTEGLLIQYLNVSFQVL